jgi:hypothetical protein
VSADPWQGWSGYQNLASVGAKVLRDIASARAARKESPEVYDARMTALREACPRIICPGCQGAALHCSICVNERGEPTGLVDDVCAGARWVRASKDRDYSAPGNPSIATLRACPVCMVPDGDGGFRVDHIGAWDRIEQVVAEAGLGAVD